MDVGSTMYISQNKKKSSCSHIIMKLQNTEDKEKIFLFIKNFYIFI